MDKVRKRRFDMDYRELGRAKDGREVLFRLIRPSDKAGLLDGLSRMSLESRYKRFFTPRDSLSPEELSYLTEIDQERHFAIAVGLTDGTEMTVGLGVGRFVCDVDNPKSAEAAVAVVDDAQGLGLGKALFERLIAAARERGIEEFHLDVLPENASMLGLMQRLFPTADAYPDSDVVYVKCPLPTAPHTTTEFPFFRVLSEAAQGTLRVMRAFRAWPLPDGLVDGLLEDSPRSEEIIQDQAERE